MNVNIKCDFLKITYILPKKQKKRIILKSCYEFSLLIAKCNELSNKGKNRNTVGILYIFLQLLQIVF